MVDWVATHKLPEPPAEATQDPVHKWMIDVLRIVHSELIHSTSSLDSVYRSIGKHDEQINILNQASRNLETGINKNIGTINNKLDAVFVDINHFRAERNKTSVIWASYGGLFKTIAGLCGAIAAMLYSLMILGVIG